jgi:hypothetical protein
MNYPRAAVLTISLLTLSMLGLAQPGDQARNGRPSARAQGEQTDRQQPQGRIELELSLDPEALRIRLQRSISRSQEMMERSQAALEKLDAGASAAEVLNELRLGNPERGQRQASRADQPMNRTPGQQQPKPDQRPTSDDAEREAMLGFLRAEFPELWKNLAPIVEQDQRNADRLLVRMAPQIREILVLQRSEPELARIKIEQMRTGLDFVEAARRYRTVIGNPDSTQQERDDALGLIRDQAERRFDVELLGKQHEIDRLEDRLIELRESVERIEQRREREVEQMVTAAQRNAERLNRQQTQRQRNSNENASGDD